MDVGPRLGGIWEQHSACRVLLKRKIKGNGPVDAIVRSKTTNQHSWCHTRGISTPNIPGSEKLRSLTNLILLHDKDFPSTSALPCIIACGHMPNKSAHWAMVGPLLAALVCCVVVVPTLTAGSPSRTDKPSLSLCSGQMACLFCAALYPLLTSRK